MSIFLTCQSKDFIGIRFVIYLWLIFFFKNWTLLLGVGFWFKCLFLQGHKFASNFNCSVTLLKKASVYHYIQLIIRKYWPRVQCFCWPASLFTSVCKDGFLIYTNTVLDFIQWFLVYDTLYALLALKFSLTHRVYFFLSWPFYVDNFVFTFLWFELFVCFWWWLIFVNTIAGKMKLW